MKGIEKMEIIENIFFGVFSIIMLILTMLMGIIISSLKYGGALIVAIVATAIITMNSITISKVEINQEYQNQMITLEVFGHQWEYFVDREDIKNF